MSSSRHGYSDDEAYMKERRKRHTESSDDGRESKRPYIGTKPLLKVLVPNHVAGALIGKGGTVLKELTSTYGGYIRVSSGGEYYPGTDERIIVVTGDENQIIDISNYIVEKTEDPGRDSSMKTVEIDEYRKQQIKIVLTDAASGLLIGRGGLTIQAIQEESKAKISVAMPDKITVSGERMVTIRGNSIEERSHACKLVIKQVAADTSNMMNTKTKYYSEVGGAMDMSPAMYGVPGLTSRNPRHEGRLYDEAPRGRRTKGGATKLPVKVQAEVTVPVEMVGAILGYKGAVIKDVVHRSGGARLRFEDKKESDDENQTLTIIGNMEQTQLAYALVNERIDLLKNNQLHEFPQTHHK